jgi:hypothetical protein
MLLSSLSDSSTRRQITMPNLFGDVVMGLGTTVLGHVQNGRLQPPDNP